ncbi:MAG: hypothetical protein WD354_08835 [Acidimicrobiia bacterium]
MSYLPGDEPATKTDVNGIRVELGAVLQRLDHLEQRMDRLEQRMDRLEQRMDRLEQRMDSLSQSMLGLSDRFHSELRAQTRTFVLGSLGSSATLAAAIVAAAAIL